MLLIPIENVVCDNDKTLEEIKCIPNRRRQGSLVPCPCSSGFSRRCAFPVSLSRKDTSTYLCSVPCHRCTQDITSPEYKGSVIRNICAGSPLAQRCCSRDKTRRMVLEILVLADTQETAHRTFAFVPHSSFLIAHSPGQPTNQSNPFHVAMLTMLTMSLRKRITLTLRACRSARVCRLQFLSNLRA